MSRVFAGGCHCGALSLNLALSRGAGEVQVRACQCSFCRRHGARNVTDAAGRVELSVPADAIRYRFGLATADYVICRRCGVYVGAVAAIDGASFATININALKDAAAFTQEPQAVDYDSETAEARLARRRALWTPATLIGL